MTALEMLVHTCLHRRPSPEHTWRIWMRPMEESPWERVLQDRAYLQERIAHVLLACLHDDPGTPPPTDPERLALDLMAWADSPPFIVASQYIFRRVGGPRITLARAICQGTVVLAPLELLALPPALAPRAIEAACHAFDRPLDIPVTLDP